MACHADSNAILCVMQRARDRERERECVFESNLAHDNALITRRYAAEQLAERRAIILKSRQAKARKGCDLKIL